MLPTPDASKMLILGAYPLLSMTMRLLATIAPLYSKGLWQRTPVVCGHG
jgi:hypothetical protein